MKAIYRKIVFSNSRLTGCFKFENKFQILPMDMEGKPQSPYAKHFPLILEYSIEPPQKCTPLDIELIRINKEKEILNLLSCLTNYRFFNYDSSMSGWGVILPNKLVEEMTEAEIKRMNEQESCLFIGGYVYDGLKQDLFINCFSDYAIEIAYKEAQMHEYYMDNSVDNDRKEITFPNTISYAIDCYYRLSENTRRKVNSSIYLACDGMDISEHKRNLSFLSYVSAIEGLLELETNDGEIKFACNSCKSISSSPYTCPQCNRPIWGIKQKFINFLSTFVAGSEKSKKIYRDIYNLRCKITHTGKLFIGDYELSLDEGYAERENKDWLMRLKTLQLFRISLNSWLRYANKKKT